MSQLTEGKILQTLSLNKKSADYEEGYANGLKDAIKHCSLKETRYDGDYPNTTWVCENCGEDLWEGANYCSNCGFKLDEKAKPIPDTECRLCRWSYTGLKEDCHWSLDGSCKHDAEPHWIDKGDYAVCSVCGAISGTQYDGVQPIPKVSKYCPDCGAKMRGC